MKILVAGAHGTTGKQIIEILARDDQHESVAMIRKEEQAQVMKQLGADHTVLADLTDDLSGVAEGVDAVIFAAGSKGKNLEGVDRKGAEKLIDEAKSAGVKHFVMLSAYGTDNPQGELKEYLAAKAEADDYLRNSGLAYTIVRPGYLGNTAPTGKVSIASHFDSPGTDAIPRADVADVLVKALEVENVKGKTFELLKGDTHIVEAMQRV